MNSNSIHQPTYSKDPICSPNISVPATTVESENVSSKDKPKKKGFARCIKRMTRTFRTTKTTKKSANLDEKLSMPANPLGKQITKDDDNVQERKVSFEEANGESKDTRNISGRLKNKINEEQTVDVINKTISKERKEKIISTDFQDSPNLSNTKSRFHIICSHNDLHSFDVMQKNSARPIRYTGSIKYDGPRSIERVLHEKRKANERKSIIKNGSMKEIKFAKDESGLNFECSSFIDESDSHTR